MHCRNQKLGLHMFDTFGMGRTGLIGPRHDNLAGASGNFGPNIVTCC